MKRLTIYSILILIITIVACTKSPVDSMNLKKNHAGLGLIDFKEVQKTHSSISVSATASEDGNSIIKERGFCWNTEGEPTVNDSIYVDSERKLGTYDGKLSGMWGSTTYFIKAYLKTEKGVFYSEQIESKTNEPVLPVVSSIPPHDIGAFSIKIKVGVEDTGGRPILEKGAVISRNPNPTIETSIEKKEQIEIIFSKNVENIDKSNQEFNPSKSKNVKASKSSLESSNKKIVDESEEIILRNLIQQTTYFVRTYVKTEVGLSYGEEYQVRTINVLQTIEVRDIFAFKAKCGGFIKTHPSDSILKRGVVWSTSPNPTTDSNITEDGEGFGYYESLLSNLTENTTYYVRSYALSTSGLGYGNEISFTTKDRIIQIETVGVSDITAFTANVHVAIKIDEEIPIIEKGIVISNNPNPSTLDTKVKSSSEIESFEILLSNLSVDTEYFARAYMIDEFGIYYGNEITFTTSLTYVNQLGIEMIYIRPGSFYMGSSTGESDERPVHKVTITKGFFMSKFEITQKQWNELMSSNPSGFIGSSLPVDRVSWNDAQAYVNNLNAMFGGKRYRLPTEAEWEYCAQAGAAANSEGTNWHFGNEENTLGEYAWYLTNSSSKTVSVGVKKPNAFGLYDMNGNVWEWVSDWYSYYPSSDQTNPEGPYAGSKRIIRGGSFNTVSDFTRTANRSSRDAESTDYSIGFRIVRNN